MSYTVSQADLSRDRAAILALWQANLPGAPAERFTWLYESGRAGAWLLLGDDSSTLGSAGVMDRILLSSGNTLRTGQAIDLNVDEHHRHAGPALRLAREAVRQADQGRYQLLYAFPNSESEPVLRRVGYKCLGNVQRWAKPLRPAELLSRRVGHPWTHKALSVACAAVDTAMALPSWEMFHRQLADARVSVTDSFDASFDRLWQNAHSQFPVIGERTAAYLTWRFCQSPDAGHEVFCVRNDQEELSAYLVFSCRRETAYVSDFLFADVPSLNLLLTEFLRLMRRRKMAAVITVYVGSSVVPQALKRLGFWSRPSPWKAMVYAPSRESRADAALLPDIENWYLTRADIDTDF